jgi:hypothetical protein
VDLRPSTDVGTNVDLAVSQPNPERRLHVQPAPDRILRCAECDAPVDGVQRYCIVCGAHQFHAEDPAARYMSALAAQRRTSSEVRRSSRVRPTVSRALLIACVSVALLVGALAGRAWTSGDARPTTGSTVRSTTAASRSAAAGQTVKRLQKLTGSSYLKSQQGLPNQVSVP